MRETDGFHAREGDRCVFRPEVLEDQAAAAILEAGGQVEGNEVRLPLTAISMRFARHTGELHEIVTLLPTGIAVVFVHGPDYSDLRLATGEEALTSEQHAFLLRRFLARKAEELTETLARYTLRAEDPLEVTQEFAACARDQMERLAQETGAMSETARPAPLSPTGEEHCLHTTLLVRVFEEQTGRVYLLGDEIGDIFWPECEPEFTGEVEVECQEEGCGFSQSFKEWGDAPEPLRSRIEQALDTYYV